MKIRRRHVFCFGAVALCGVSLWTGLMLWRVVHQATVQATPKAVPRHSFRIPSGDRETPSEETFRPGWAAPEQEAITEIQTVSADQITDEVEEQELVLGVVIDNQARAYSINTLSGPHREIFNDFLADTAIAATW